MFLSNSQGPPNPGNGLGGLPQNIEIFSGLPWNIEKFSGLPRVRWVNLGLRKKIG